MEATKLARLKEIEAMIEEKQNDVNVLTSSMEETIQIAHNDFENLLQSHIDEIKIEIQELIAEKETLLKI